MKIGQWLGIIALVISLYILWQVRQLLLLGFTAIVLSTAINHLVQRLQRSGLKRSQAVLLSIGLVGAVLILTALLVLPPFIEQFQDLIALLPAGLSRMQDGMNWLEERLGANRLEIPDATGLIQQIQPLGSNLAQRMIAFFSTSINFLLNLVLVLALTLMLLVNPQPYRQVLIRSFPSFYRSRVDHILSCCADGLGAWTTGALIEMIFIATLSGVGLWLLQVPLPLAHAVLAGLLNFIPNIGPTLSAVLPMAIGFMDAPWKAIAVLVLYLVIQNIESYWLTPTVMAKQVSLLPALTLLSQLFFVTFFGALGLVMALPLAVVAKVWIEEAVYKDILDRWQHTSS